MVLVWFDQKCRWFLNCFVEIFCEYHKHHTISPRVGVFSRWGPKPTLGGVGGNSGDGMSSLPHLSQLRETKKQASAHPKKDTPKHCAIQSSNSIDPGAAV